MPESPDAHVDATYDKAVRARLTARGRQPATGDDLAERWPDRVDLRVLARPDRTRNPWGDEFDYAAAFLSVDLDELARDVDAVLVTSQDWWPADFGHYGPLVLRMAWHGAGTYRMRDGRGGPSAGQLRFAPLNSWPDNRNLDKARRLLWPVKQKYGRTISWPDLMIFAGNRALESMGFTTLGFAGGREDTWASDETYWGPERAWLADERHQGIRDLDEPLAASDMGLIYVDPQGPGTVPDPRAAARDIRQTFGRMGLDDEETVALIAGGHTFGKTHGAADPTDSLGPEPESAPLEEQGLGWASSFKSGRGAHAVVSGLEGTWTPTPTTWDTSYLETLFAYDWEVELSPAGQWQWVPRDGAGAGTVPGAHEASGSAAPRMLTTDLALQEDPAYEAIARKFLQEPDLLQDAFAHAWYKLTHIDMGPIERYLGPWVPSERMIWQDPLPEREHDLVGADDVVALKRQILQSGLAVSALVSTAWASASTFRTSDKRGGANGARLRLEPQRSWDVNEPDTLAGVLDVLEQIRVDFNAAQPAGTSISLADVIVLGGCAAIEHAAASAGHDVEVPFQPGRTDATQEWTDQDWFAVLEPSADGFRNYVGQGIPYAPEHLLVERAAQLTLTAPEMTVLLGGLRVLGANHQASPAGQLTTRPGALTNDFFVNLLDMAVTWAPGDHGPDGGIVYEGRARDTGTLLWVASRVDLVFAAHAELRAVAEVYASDDGQVKLVHDFVAAWHKVMSLDRFGTRPPDM